MAPEYNRKHLFVRRYELQSFLRDLSSLEKELLTSKKRLNYHLTELYSENVIEEWLDLYVAPVEKQINTTFAELLPIYSKKTWQRRPFI